MKPLELLGHVADELEWRLDAGSQYDLLRAAGLLRLALLDEQALLPRLSKDRVKLWYYVRTPSSPLGLSMTVSPDSDPVFGYWGLSPWPPMRPFKIDHDAFIARPVAFCPIGTIKVRTAVRTAAHGFGGVHFADSIDGDEDQALYDYVTRIGWEPVTGPITTMIQDIGRVTLGSMRHLLARASEQRGFRTGHAHDPRLSSP